MIVSWIEQEDGLNDLSGTDTNPGFLLTSDSSSKEI